MSDIVDLNVGGATFTTTMATLSKYDSMLRGLVTHPTARDRKGRIFVDRDGKMFRYELQFLREGHLDLSAMSSEKISMLRAEAQYYCIEEMVTICCPPPMPVSPSNDLPSAITCSCNYNGEELYPNPLGVRASSLDEFVRSICDRGYDLTLMSSFADGSGNRSDERLYLHFKKETHSIK
eukprot:TRINITY_DN8495_c0_g1_i1.p1 TRINITY_DN8495_c0_g1~~TRINITY_DN8495_c0_g1_i1.p1  ORF type:complete len:179 (+),score=16.41 TRINITY_DN8495_c0_g1_i1:59-595(+)